LIDVDGDGKLDTILPRLFSRKSGRSKRGRPKATDSHWIAFDLKTSNRRLLRSFFRFEYGDAFGDYWVYALVPCDIDKNGKVDLVFYSGDDTSDETIVLINRNGRFFVHSRKKSKSSS
jgi:hypothetical protein